MEEEFLQITPGLVRLHHVKDLVGTLRFHDVDAAGGVHREAGPLGHCTAWQEGTELGKLAVEGPVVHVPGSK